MPRTTHHPRSCAIVIAAVAITLLTARQGFARAADADALASAHQMDQLRAELLEAEAEAEARQYEDGLILALVQMRIQLLKLAMTSLEINKGQAAGVAPAQDRGGILSWFGRNAPAPVAEKPLPPREVVLACPPRDDLFFLDPAEGTIRYSSDSAPISLSRGSAAYAWSDKNRDGQRVDCELHRYSLRLRCSVEDQSAKPGAESGRCALIERPAIPDSGTFAIACRDRKQAGRGVADVLFVVDVAAAVVIDDNGRAGRLLHEKRSYFTWETSGETAEQCSLNRYTGQIYCGADRASRWDLLGEPYCRTLAEPRL